MDRSLSGAFGRSRRFLEDIYVRFPWRTLSALVVLALVGGLWAGWRFATLTETDVINAAAAHYVENGPVTAVPEHCVAQPGTPPVWVTIICRAPEAAAMIFQADRFGRLSIVDPADLNTAAQS